MEGTEGMGDGAIPVDAEDLSFEDEDQIQVQFFTKLKDPRLHIEDTPFFVPLKLSRQGLSEIINSLLDLGHYVAPSLRRCSDIKLTLSLSLLQRLTDYSIF